MREITAASATELARAIRAKEVSSVEVTQAHLSQIEAVNPKINGVVQVTAESALKRARELDRLLANDHPVGPLHGVPTTVKDGWDLAGVISTAGTEGRKSFVPAESATVVSRVYAAGCVILGKTNVPELSCAFETDNLVYGRTNNPYKLDRTSGGSGGGGAASIASGMSPFEIGEDTGGSIRLPSHCCGIAGIRSTTGRVPLTGYYPPIAGLVAPVSAAGPMARRVEDLFTTLSVVAGPDWRDPQVVPMPLGDPRAVRLPRLRVAFHTDNGIFSPTSETATAVIAAAKACGEAGMIVEEKRPNGIEHTNELFLPILAADGGAEISRWLKQAGTTHLHPSLARLLQMEGGLQVSGADLAAGLSRLDQFRSAMIWFMRDYDVIISPVAGCPALPHGKSFDEDVTRVFSYTATYNLTGWPAVVVRAGTSPEGLPIGVQVIAKPWREDVALAVANHVEVALGGWLSPLMVADSIPV